MRAFRKVAGNFNGSPKADTAAQRLGQLFETVFLQGDLDASSPMVEVALYTEFKELTPAGDKGRQIILGLSRRLMALDLAEQVIALIEPTLRTAPADNRRAELGLVLAEAYARAGNWEAVIDALKRTAGNEAAPPLSDNRNLLAAKALMQLGRRDEALARLATLGGADAMRMRAALLRRDGDWKAVAEAIDRLLATQGQVAPAAVRGAVIDLSVARTLAGDTAAIGEIAREQAPVMAGTADEAAFRLLTGSGIGAVPDRESLSSRSKKRFVSAMPSRRRLSAARGRATRRDTRDHTPFTGAERVASTCSGSVLLSLERRNSCLMTGSHIRTKDEEVTSKSKRFWTTSLNTMAFGMPASIC